MPGKQRPAPPIDRPLSRAYLRGFTGWSTAYPPGQSEPTSLRLMENVMVDRNGALQVRPGLRYLSYKQAPNMAPDVEETPGLATDRPLVGTQEPFYLTDGGKALLFAVREEDGTVGFRAIRFADATTVVHRLTDPLIGFRIPQGESTLNFSAETTHVEYLQINNRIVALSDAGESMRMFFVGGEKVAKKLSAITVPEWEDAHKLNVIHPVKDWIDKQTYSHRRNELRNSSFELGGAYWSKSSTCAWESTTGPSGQVAEGKVLKISSAPQRTNMQTSPLHDVSTTGTTGWYADKSWGNPRVTKDGDWMKVIDAKGKGTFLANGARVSHGVVAGQKYQVAVDYECGSHVDARVLLTFYNAAGAKIGSATTLKPSTSKGRYASSGITAPVGTTSMRITLGGYNKEASSTFVKFKNVVLCKESEVTTMFHGGSGTNYFWTGEVNKSPSVYHPPADITVTSPRGAIQPSAACAGYIHVQGAAKPYTIKLRTYNKDGAFLYEYSSAGTVSGSWVPVTASTALTNAQAVTGELVLSLTGVARGQYVYLDAAMLEPGVSSATPYFDGNTPPTDRTSHAWEGAAHESPSVATTYNTVPPFPTKATPTANTLISSAADSNKYKMAMFYVFENEVGESFPSKMTEVRMMRPWSNWKWETPSATGEPSGTATESADRCADQLVAVIPQAVYDRALAEGAIKWTLLGIAWSDQEPVPPVAQVIGERALYADPTASLSTASALPYKDGGWIAVTPARKAGFVEAFLPTVHNRVNHSVPPRSRTGLVAGDRIILVGDPTELATIRWSSNRPGEYTNFTSTKGGGAKTLTTGNLNIPAAVVLWQNPQSVDTLTILCMGSDGQSTSYYMSPAQVGAQAATTSIMGFEETTSTPGTMSPYAAEVMNNSLFRPIDRSLLKSNAANYNINHKSMSDKIQNVWTGLLSKQWVMSGQLDNRLYYLVHNPRGEQLEAGCKGNELWVFDGSAENGTWSRWLVQGAALRAFNVGPRTYMGLTRPEGLYYLDPEARLDDYVISDGSVLQRPIPWMFETNTQGANRAHDAWAHLQQVGVVLGNFHGAMKYGVRGRDVNGFDIDVSKIVRDDEPIPDDVLTWDIEDALLIKRDLKEWFFYAESVPDLEGSGQIGYVQYRYTPVSVNVGYEFGSVETFEYGSNAALGNDGYAASGVPRPYMDFNRP